MNVKIFEVQGQALDQFAKKTCKILVVGNPANTNALICSHYAPSIPKEGKRKAHPLHRCSCSICIRIVTMTCVKYTVTV